MQEVVANLRGTDDARSLRRELSVGKSVSFASFLLIVTPLLH